MDIYIYIYIDRYRKICVREKGWYTPAMPPRRASTGISALSNPSVRIPFAYLVGLWGQRTADALS